MNDPMSPLSCAVGPLCSLGLFRGRITGSVVGRSQELVAVEQELKAARRGLACLTVEGEPGIGKTRLLLAIEEMARNLGFLPVAVTADEEIRGPFLLARSIFASPAALEAAEGRRAAEPVQRVVDALSNQDDPGLERMAPNQKLLRVFDLAAVGFRGLAADQPLVVLIDDLQWADEDSLRMLRYAVRVDTASPILLVFAIRSDEIGSVNEAVTLLADMERMGILRHLRLRRFRQSESTEFLSQVLGGPINLSSAAVMHAQAEGVPFILEEQVQTYRDAGLLQQIEGAWALAPNAGRLLPSAVRTLIQRRAARLPAETRSSLAEAAVLGRSFSLRDLHDLMARLGEDSGGLQTLADILAPAVAAGLLVEQPPGSSADYSFTHDRIRDYATAGVSLPRRRAVHAAVVDMLTAGGDPPPALFSVLAQHALAAGQAELAARVSIEAARAALHMHAPEEALRLVDLAHPVASTPQDRVALLRLRDDALDMLRRPAQRLESLAELSALAEALGNGQLGLEVMLRRAAALRLSQEHDRASDLARRVSQVANERGDTEAELAACLELGQDLLRTELGEGYAQAPSEADIDGAAEAYGRAVALAEVLVDQPRLAAAVRELGIIAVSRVRAWFVAAVVAGEHIEILRRILAGERMEDIFPTLEIAPTANEAFTHLRRALQIYEQLGDKKGTMSTIIALAFVSWGPELHGLGSAKRIEELRRLAIRLTSFTKESERALADAQMLFGCHVYARAKVFPDVALVKGAESHAAAQSIGDRSLEFSAAGGMALVHAELGSPEEADRWLGRAAAVATAAPSPHRLRQLESWRGIVRAAGGDGAGMREHLERAVQLASDLGRPAPRCEALAILALQAARLGAERQDESLLAVAERSAAEARGLLPVLPGHPPWGAQADAALARVALARGNLPEAARAGRAALAALDGAMREDMFLDVLLPAADAVLRTAAEDEAVALRDRLNLTLGLLAQHILDEEIRVRWFRSSVGRELTRLAGPLEASFGSARPAATAAPFAEGETSLLRLLAEGRTNSEIADELNVTEEAVARQLAELFVKIGVSSRADATAEAFMGKLV